MVRLSNQETDFSAKIASLEQELEEKRAEIAALERTNRHLEDKLKASEMPEGPAAFMELEDTLKRLVTKIAMILQAEKCVFMLYDKDSAELRGTRPSFGMADEEIEQFRMMCNQGVSGEVFSESKPLILYDAANDPRALQEKVRLFNLKNGVCVPLTVEKRDESSNRVLECKVIGVLHVFNKLDGGVFIQEDVNLLNRLARNAASVIASAQMYREVIEEKQELESFIENAYAGLIMVNKSGRITQMNASARTMLGIDNDVVCTVYDETIKHEPVLSILRRSLETGCDVAEEISIILPDEPDEEKIYQVQCSPVGGDDQQPAGVVAIFNDITEMRSIERMKTAFVSTVSHELRTPLTSIKGFISTLMADDTGKYYDVKAQHEFYRIIDGECDRLTRLINDLLNVSRIEAGRALDLIPKLVKLLPLIEKVAAAQRTYTHKHQVVIDIESELPDIIADEDKVDQILTNLINNAIKYSPKGGTVTVTGGVDGDTVKISVTDQGMGIPKDHLTKVFDRFHRVDNRDTRKIGGTGIGLYLVKHLVEAHGGSIWVESEVGVGTTFMFELPMCPPQFEGDKESLIRERRIFL